MRPTIEEAEARYRDNTLLTTTDLNDRVPGANDAYWADLRYNGTGPEYVKLSAKRVLYPERQFLEWLATKRRTSTKGGDDV